jgi:preprotein translocase subunit SecE
VNYTPFIWIAVVIAVFAILWWSGQLVRIRNYWDGTMQELKRCTWPTWNELKGSTVVVMISILILGVFTMLVDFVFSLLVRSIT